jgi:hypothetical protein
LISKVLFWKISFAARGAASYKMLFREAIDKVALTLPGSGVAGTVDFVWGLK